MGRGNPFIILPGMISPLEEWEGLVEELSQFGRVFLMNRAGCGNSEKGIKSRNVKENARDVKGLIDELNIVDPIIVGHSYGGLYTQYFGYLYPDIASGFVLIDSTSVNMHLLDEIEVDGGDENSTEAWIEKCKSYAIYTPDALKAELDGWIYELQRPLNKEKQSKVRDFMVNGKMFEALGEELENDPRYMDELRNFGGLPDVPTIILGRDPEVSIQEMINEEEISHDEATNIERVWQTLIKDQTKLNQTNEYILVDGAGHNIHKDRPDIIKRVMMSLVK